MSSPGSATAADCPGVYDVVINGYGYVLADTVESSLPFRTHRAIYDITPTFVERTNVNNTYGDQTQDFFMAVSQNDWSLGEDQRHLELSSADTKRRFWKGLAVDVRVPGRVTVRRNIHSYTAADSLISGVTMKDANGLNTNIVAASATNLYQVAPDGTITDESAHGLGVSPLRAGICSDGANVYLSSTQTGTVGVRKWDGSAYSTFSTQPVDALEFLNNTLYGFHEGDSILYQYSTTGTATAAEQWKDAGGTGIANQSSRTVLKSYGGQLAILFGVGWDSNPGSQVWVWDGTGASLLLALPVNFEGSTLAVVDGILLIGGCFYRQGASDVQPRPAVYYYANGNQGLLWQADDYMAASSAAFQGHARIVPADGGAFFTDDYTATLRFWDPASGAISTVGGYTVAGNTPELAASSRFVLHMRDQTAVYVYPDETAQNGGAYVETSLIDFDTSLEKQFRGIAVEGDIPNLANIGISYQVDSLDGSWTSLTTNATSGTEYTLDNVSGHAIAVKVTLGTNTFESSSVLRRISVRAAPVLRQFKSGLYILDCTGGPDDPRTLRDGSYHPLTGAEQVQNLLAAAVSTAPFSVTDKVNGTFTGLVDLQDSEGWDVYEVHPSTDNPKHAGSFLVRLKVREV